MRRLFVVPLRVLRNVLANARANKVLPVRELPQLVPSEHVPLVLPIHLLERLCRQVGVVVPTQHVLVVRAQHLFLRYRHPRGGNVVHPLHPGYRHRAFQHPRPVQHRGEDHLADERDVVERRRPADVHQLVVNLRFHLFRHDAGGLLHRPGELLLGDALPRVRLCPYAEYLLHHLRREGRRLAGAEPPVFLGCRKQQRHQAGHHAHHFDTRHLRVRDGATRVQLRQQLGVVLPEVLPEVAHPLLLGLLAVFLVLLEPAQ